MKSSELPLKLTTETNEEPRIRIYAATIMPSLSLSWNQEYISNKAIARKIIKKAAQVHWFMMQIPNLGRQAEKQTKTCQIKQLD